MSTCVPREIVTIATTGIGERFAPLRIVEPQAERAMLHSMEKYGQLTPVAVCRTAPGEHELLDGFKRLRAARQLGLAELTARPFDLSIRAGKATMLQLNRVGRVISGMEEALVVHSLYHEDGLNQVEIALLLNRHKSWVCRRLALIERLSDEAQQMIRLGLLPASLGTELARLQRRNQDQLLAAIREHQLSVRETRVVVNALENEPRHNHEAILRDPRGSLLSSENASLAPAEEKGVSFPLKKVLRRLVALERSCLEVALLVCGTDPIMYEQYEETRLRAACGRALPSLARVEQELRAMAAHGVRGEP
jgi:ParB/RepB/Spo0J family partition protein